MASGTTVVGILAAISVSHLLNDTIQSLIPSIYPILKSSFQLNFSQIGLIALTLQLTASLLQPVVGMYTDRRPMPYSLVGGMAFSLVGLLLLSVAATLATILVAAGFVGIGSSVFHPESSRVARMASGGTTTNAASSGPIDEPRLPPTWNTDCASPCRPPDAMRATRDDSG